MQVSQLIWVPAVYFVNLANQISMYYRPRYIEVAIDPLHNQMLPNSDISFDRMGKLLWHVHQCLDTFYEISMQLLNEPQP